MAGARSRARLTAALAVIVFMASGCAWLARSSVPRLPNLITSSASQPALSGSGRLVIFSGYPSDYLDVPLSDGQVLLRDHVAKSTELVSVATDGAVANARSTPVGISDDGRYVAFRSTASNLATGDTDALMDTFVRDRQTHTTTLVSLNDDESPITDANASGCAMSGDGNVVVLCLGSPGPSIPPAPGELAVRDILAGTTRVLPHLHSAPYPGFARLSEDGSLVAYGDGTLNGSQSTMWMAIARTDSGALVKDLGSALIEFLDAGAVDVDISGDGSTYAVTEGHHKYDQTSTGAVTIGRVDGTTPPVVHRYRWARRARLNRDGSVVAVQILSASGPEVLAIDRGTDPPLVVSADATGTKPVAVDGDIDLSADGKWVAFVSADAQALVGSSPSISTYDVYTRSIAQSLDPPS